MECGETEDGISLPGMDDRRNIKRE